MRLFSSLKNPILLVTISLTILSCDIIDLSRNKYSIGHIPTSSVNLEEFNTEFDDYNSDIPFFGETFPFCFSSNRNSNGADFDIVYKLMSVKFSKKTGELHIYEDTDYNMNTYIVNQNIWSALTKVNSPFDEFGPCLIPMGTNYQGTNMNAFETYIFLFSNNSNGNQDIFFTHNLEIKTFADPSSVEIVNSDYDDAYPTFNKDNSEIYFTSNRAGKFDLYKLRTDNNKEMLQMLTANNAASVEIDSTLSSEFDDKCPSITNNILVFTSNREGGFGGYDLYYSSFKNGIWNEPINFGSDINTEYDEYRPIVRSNPMAFDNDMMIFSSNRPGGKGGFDLYCVGIQRKEEIN